MKKLKDKALCSVCLQDLGVPYRKSNSGEHCPVCAQGMSKATLDKAKTLLWDKLYGGLVKIADEA